MQLKLGNKFTEIHWKVGASSSIENLKLWKPRSEFFRIQRNQKTESEIQSIEFKESPSIWSIRRSIPNLSVYSKSRQSLCNAKFAYGHLQIVWTLFNKMVLVEYSSTKNLDAQPEPSLSY